MTQLVVFSDIDGTLIDFEHYAFDASREAVAALLARDVPLILCSSKTRAEQQVLRDALGIPDPFIVENGSAIFVPDDYFPFPLPGARQVAGHQVIELGVDAGTIHTVIEEVRNRTALDFRGYADLTLSEVAQVTGLELPAAERARRREYSETIVTPLAPPGLSLLRSALAADGLAITSGGKFHTVTGAGSDKGRAVHHLATLLRQKLGEIETVGLGDSPNDAPLLAAVDRAYLVQKPGGVWEDLPGIAVQHVPAVGPAGWRWAIQSELARQ